MKRKIGKSLRKKRKVLTNKSGGVIMYKWTVKKSRILGLFITAFKRGKRCTSIFLNVFLILFWLFCC